MEITPICDLVPASQPFDGFFIKFGTGVIYRMSYSCEFCEDMHCESYTSL